ncbi:MAG: hypothetical protein LQ351_007962 [Letrouitia transgressa]|nr:MAG: hypothetical protein LQ351_007962 [Letrouitia transgressa]
MLKKSLDWIEEADFEAKIVVAGNHDITLDPDFYEQHYGYFHKQNPQNSASCLNLIRSYSSIQFLNHESVRINLLKPDGPRSTFKVFGSPYSPDKGLWAFGYSREKAFDMWDSVPLDTDIVITHTPPRFHCDESKDQGATGCESLRETLWRVRPPLAICGHVHEGRGVERVVWDLTAANIKHKEYDTGYWSDPGAGNKKQSFVDLSSRGPDPLRTSASSQSHGKACHSGRALKTYWRWQSESGISDNQTAVQDEPVPAIQDHPSMPILHRNSSATRGQGGILPSARCDLIALTDRLDRQETCIVNAAVMATSWPYQARHGSKFNKPIVVDIDLPQWEDSA